MIVIESIIEDGFCAYSVVRVKLIFCEAYQFALLPL